MCVLVYTLRNDTRSVAALTNVGPLTVRNTVSSFQENAESAYPPATSLRNWTVNNEVTRFAEYSDDAELEARNVNS